MRVRIFGLRLLAGALTGLWAIAGAIVLLVYRPGGPIDGIVGLAALLPIGVSLLGLLWPPATRGDRAFAAVTWLGLGAILLLIPSIGGVLTQLLARGPQTLLPSWEAAYPWVLALLATSLFGGLGVARRYLGSSAMRRRRLELGLLVAVAATGLSGSLFAAAAIANELALRDLPARSSRFGPTTAVSEPARCTAPLSSGPSAVIAETIRGDVDGRPIGTVEVHGIRNGLDVSWVANVATEVAIGQYAITRVDATTWARTPSATWRTLPIAVSASAAPEADAAQWNIPGGTSPVLDRTVTSTALDTDYRSAAEDRGLEFVEGARARHCRIALDGRTFQAAFPVAGWISVDQDLHRWRGSLDYWIFLDGEVGQVTAVVNGEAASLRRSGLQANLIAMLTATDRGEALIVETPRP